LLDEPRGGRELGEKEFGQKDLGPEDALTPGISDLLGAFSPSRLTGKSGSAAAVIPTFPEALIRTLPQSGVLEAANTSESQPRIVAREATRT
jgi:hypothetical protein